MELEFPSLTFTMEFLVMESFILSSKALLSLKDSISLPDLFSHFQVIEINNIKHSKFYKQALNAVK